MDRKGKAKFLASLALEAIKNDEDVERAIEKGLEKLERAETGPGTSVA